MNANLKKALKERTKKYCNAEKVRNSTLFPENYPKDQPACWLCWLRLTGEDLQNWRKPPYYSVKLKHEKECPVCGYTHWEGAAWYPFRYIHKKGKRLLNNPSFKREEDATD